MGTVMLLSIGGIAGTLARYFLAGAVYRAWGTSFPFGTLAVNASGCFLIGMFGALAESKLSFGPQMRLLLMVGFCGAFTTFSTFIYESNGLLQDGELAKTCVNVIASVLTGFLLFKLGVMLGKIL